MLASVKPFSSPLYEDAALKKCHFICILKSQHSAAAEFILFCIQVMRKRRGVGGCVPRRRVNCITMHVVCSNKYS